MWPGPVEYLYNGSAGNTQNPSVNLSTATANAVDNKAYVGVRWKYYYISGASTNGARIKLGNISVTSIAVSGNSIATGAIAGSPFCVTPTTGYNISVPFTYAPSGNFPTGATNFTAQLSNSAGIFTSPTVIGTIVSNGSGTQTISATLPANTGTGISYRIRVVSDVPAAIGSDNGTDLIIRLSPSDVTNTTALPANLSATIGWTLPSPCFTEVMVVAYTASIATLPTGNGSAYTANAVYGSGTNFLPGFVVYKGGGSSVTVTGLTNGTQYFFKIFTRYGTDWSGGIEVNCVPGDGTILKRGDFAVVGVNAACSSIDEISFVCFKDITLHTTLDLTDNGYARSITYPTSFGNTEGVIRCTRTGGTILAGTVITFQFNAGSGSCVSPDANWSFISVVPGGLFQLNSSGDQFFFMQGGTWNNGTLGSHNAQYVNGTVCYLVLIPRQRGFRMQTIRKNQDHIRFWIVTLYYEQEEQIL